MNFKIIPTPTFAKSLKKLSKRYRSIKTDIELFLSVYWRESRTGNGAVTRHPQNQNGNKIKRRRQVWRSQNYHLQRADTRTWRKHLSLGNLWQIWCLYHKDECNQINDWRLEVSFAITLDGSVREICEIRVKNILPQITRINTDFVVSFATTRDGSICEICEICGGI